MYKNLKHAVLVISSAFIFGCSQKPTEIEGRWSIDLTKMTTLAKEQGASYAQIREIERTFDRGLLEVTNSKLLLSVDGQTGKESMNYKIINKHRDCFVLKVNSAETEHRFCVHNGQLEVHDPSTKVVAIYRKL